MYVICLVYDIYCSHGTFLHVIYMSYNIYIPILFFELTFQFMVITGFRGQHHNWPARTPVDIQGDQHPDPHDVEDFEMPDQHALIQSFLAGLSKESDNDFRGLSQLLEQLPDPTQTDGMAEVEAMAGTEAKDRGLIPEATYDTLAAFSFSEMKLYKHAMTYKWTADELINTIRLIKSTDFKVEDVNVDLHKRVAGAIAQGHFTRYERRLPMSASS